VTRAAGPVERVHIAILVLVCALMAIVVLWQLSARASIGRLLWAAVLTMPLWLPLRGLIRRNRRIYAAMTLCVTPYVVLGITEAVANPTSRGWAAASLGCALLLFAMLVGYLRMTRDQVPFRHPREGGDPSG
jgi:uncharacterized membrane protein